MSNDRNCWLKPTLDSSQSLNESNFFMVNHGGHPFVSTFDDPIAQFDANGGMPYGNNFQQDYNQNTDNSNKNTNTNTNTASNNEAMLAVTPYTPNSFKNIFSDQSMQNDIYESKGYNSNELITTAQSTSCGSKWIQSMYKLPRMPSMFMMYGDILIEPQNRYEDVDYLIDLCDIFMQKKHLNNVVFWKEDGILEVSSENKFSGFNNFPYVSAILSNSSDGLNQELAQQIQTYASSIYSVNELYEQCIRSIGRERLLEMQRAFFAEQKQAMFNEIKNRGGGGGEESIRVGNEFLSFLGYSYIDEHEPGFPMQATFGMSEANCALMGCDAAQMTEIIQRYGFVEQLFKRGFPKEMIRQQPFMQILLMTNVGYFASMRDVFHERISFLTFDGIYMNSIVKIRQIAQVVNGIVISTFFLSEFEVSHEELHRILEIRSAKKLDFTENNILEVLLHDNVYSSNANRFAKYIMDHRNFAPPKKQDLYPEKTCKIRYL